MGLSIVVGYLADVLKSDEEGAKLFREEVNRLNSFLESQGLHRHVEPEECSIYSAEMFGYSGLHYLRRIAAHLNIRGALPEPGGEDVPEDRVLKEYYALAGASGRSFFDRLFGRKSIVRDYDHLILHSDAEGYYVPQDFREVLFPPDRLGTPGGMIGSSHRLLEETTRLARAVELPLDTDPEADEVWEAAETQGEGDLLWQRFGVESFTCLRLYNAARCSIDHSAVIVFT